MRVLVTGCNGQVGYSIKEQLSTLENVVILALDKEELDITNPAAVQRLVEEFKPTVIINAAAHTAVDKAEEEVELSYSINCDGPKFLAQAAQSVGAAILHISTDYVYEGNKLGEYNEDDSTNPQSVYGSSKLAGEVEVAQHCEKHIILRTAWVFGEHGNNFVKTMLRLGSVRDELCVVGDQLGGPTYAGDIASVLIQLALKIDQGEQMQFGVYHYTGLPHVSWYEFAAVIFDKAVEFELLDKKPLVKSITTEQYPTPAKRPSNSRLSTKKIGDVYSLEASDWKAALNNLTAYTGQ